MSVESLHGRPKPAVRPPLTVVANGNRAAQLGLSEADVLRLVQLAAGWTLTAMAKQGWVTGSAMSMRFARMRDRAGARTNEQLVSWAYQHGVLGVPRG